MGETNSNEQRLRSKYKVETARDKFRKSLDTLREAALPAIKESYFEGIKRHNEANIRLLAGRDGIFRWVRETAINNRATISSHDPLKGYYKYQMGGKNWSLIELAEKIDPQFGRTANHEIIHEGAYSRWLNNGRQIHPKDISALRVSYEKLKKDFLKRNPAKDFYVAIRSSGTLIDKFGLPISGGEDSKDNAFAGLNETLLNIASFEDMLEAIDYCFNQCGNPAAVSYMVEKGIDPTTARLPLVMQEMVKSESLNDKAFIVFGEAKLQEAGTENGKKEKFGNINIGSGMCEYFVGGLAARFSVKFNNQTGEIVEINQTKQKRALLANPFRVGNYDTNLDISLPDVMESRFSMLENAINTESFDDDFYKEVRKAHLIKVNCSSEDLIEIAKNLISHKDQVMALSRDLDNLDSNPATIPTSEELGKIVQQVMSQEKRFGYKPDMEGVFPSNAQVPTLLQIRPLTGNAVPIEKGPESKLPTIARGSIASPGVISGKLIYVEDAEDMNAYAEHSKNEILIPFFPEADTLYTPVEMDPNCPGAVALNGTPQGHAGIIASEIAPLRPESGFPYLVGLTGAQNEKINSYYDFLDLILSNLDSHDQIVREIQQMYADVLGEMKETYYSHLNTLNQKNITLSDKTKNLSFETYFDLILKKLSGENGRLSSNVIKALTRDIILSPYNFLLNVPTDDRYLSQLETIKSKVFIGIRRILANYSDATVYCWSPNVADGRILLGKDSELENKWKDWWKANQYVIKENVIKPDGKKIKVGAILSIPEAAKDVYKAGFDEISLFRMEESYRTAFSDPRLPEDMNGFACHPFEFFERNLDQVLEDHLFARLKTVIENFPDKPVTIRAMDFQPDDMKSLKFFDKHYKPNSGGTNGERGAYLFRTNERLFQLEARLIQRLLKFIEENEYKNVIKYEYPFFRTASDSILYVKLKEQFNLVDSKFSDGNPLLKLGVMGELPAVDNTDRLFNDIKEVEEIQQAFGGELPFSIFKAGMNDDRQSWMGLARNNPDLVKTYSPEDYVVYTEGVQKAYEGCKKHGIEYGTCGDSAGKEAKIAKFLYDLGIDVIGVSPAYLGPTHTRLLSYAQKERNERKFVVPFVSQLKV